MPWSVLLPCSCGANRSNNRSEAQLVFDYQDRLDGFNLSWVCKQFELRAVFPENENEAKILQRVTHEPIHIDEMIRSSGLNISTDSSVLAMMELRGMVRQAGGMNYVRLKETVA